MKLKNIKKNIKNKDKNISVTGIGNAIVDVVALVKDDFLIDRNICKGSMKLISEEEAYNLHSNLDIKKIMSGGSAANTIAGLAYLGNKTAFIGKVKNDSLGREFEKDLKKLGVIYRTKKAKGNCPSTGCCIVLTTPDAQRTMNTFLGISCLLNKEDIDEDIILKSNVVYIESFLLDKDNAREAVLEAFNFAKNYNTKIAISLSDALCVKRNLDILNELIIKKGINICFGNEQEINEFLQTKRIEDAISILKDKNFSFITVITLGEKGSIVIFKDKEYFIDAYKVKTIDSTGAGDIFAAGFLHGFVRNFSLDECAKIGNLLASHIVTQFGARPEMSFLEILSDINKKNVRENL